MKTRDPGNRGSKIGEKEQKVKEKQSYCPDFNKRMEDSGAGSL